MMKPTLDGLKAFMGEAAFQRWMDDRPLATLALDCQYERLLAAIIPCCPRTAAQQDAFVRAVYTQAAFDFDGLRGVSQMDIGSFSVRMEPQPELCPEARAILMNAGLLYRGVTC